jgi:serine/threonine protein kinase
MAWDRKRLLKKGITVSDADLDSCFNLWHRESRAYEHIDRYIPGPQRSLYPEYYGTSRIPHYRCPAGWRYASPDQSMVCIIVLELFEEPRSRKVPIDLSLSTLSLQMAKELYSGMKDHKYIHIFIHLCEMLDPLHQTGVIHGDIKPENLINCSVAEIAVLCDFSIAWVHTNGRPCLDRFQHKPTTLEEDIEGEREGMKDMVIRYGPQFFSLNPRANIHQGKCRMRGESTFEEKVSSTSRLPSLRCSDEGDRIDS